MATVLPDASRFLGLHFFSPAHVMRLVEVVKGRHTSAQVIGALLKFVKRLGKVMLRSPAAMLPLCCRWIPLLASILLLHSLTCLHAASVGSCGKAMVLGSDAMAL